MSFEICPSCAALRPAQAACPQCGCALISLDEERLERLLAIQTTRRMRVQLYRWIASEQVDPEVAARLLQQLEDPPFFAPPAAPAAPVVTVAAATPAPPEPPEVVPLAAPVVMAVALAEPAPVAEHAAALEAAGLPEAARGAEAGWGQGESALDDGASGGGDLDSADDGEHAHEGALGALVAVDDEDDGPGVGSWLYENIGWFLGATLVLAGSIYGVREAWQALGDVPRHLVVAGALLGYHSGFVGVGALLARSSKGAGRVLSSIGWLLLPVVFVALSSLVDASPVVGLGAAAAAAAVAWFTQGSVAARFEQTSGTALTMATLPALVAMLPIAASAPGSWARHLAPLAGLAGVSLAARAGDAWALLASVVASLAVWTFSIAGSPGEADASLGAIALASTALWTAGLAGVVREGLARDAIRSRGPAVARGVEVLALALTACSALGVALAARSGITDRTLALGYLAAATAASLVFARAVRAAPGAIHLLVPTSALTAWMAVTTLFPGTPTLWPAGPALVASGLLWWGARHERRASVGWGLGLGVLVLLWAFPPVAGSPPAHFLLTAGPLAVAAHLAASRWPALHYAGGAVVALIGVAAARLLRPDGSFDAHIAVVYCAVYGAVALLRKPAEGSSLSPLDDLSLLAAVSVGLLQSTPTRTPPWVTTPPVDVWPAPAALLREVVAGQPMLLLAGALLLLRTRRDRGFLVGTAAALTLSLAVLRASGSPWLQWPPHLLGALTFGVAVVAAILRSFAPAPPPAPAAPVVDLDAPDEPAASAAPEAPAPPALPDATPARRRLLGFLPLGSGTAPIADGAAVTSVLLFLAGQSTVIDWMTNLVDARRPFFVQGAALLCATVAVWFLTPALGLLSARGSIPALVLAAVAGVGVALANRLGRPLPPDQVALRFTVIAALLWLIAEALARHGKGLGARLGKPAHGERYHAVATVGMAVLGGVMLLDAVLVGSHAPPTLATVPPLFLIGSALVAALLARRLGSQSPLHLALPLLLGGLGLAAAQHGPMGLLYIQLPDGAWYPRVLATRAFAQALADGTALPPLRSDALLGVTAGAGALALLTVLIKRTALGRLGVWWLGRKAGDRLMASALILWAALGTAGSALAAGWQSSRPSAAAMAATGALIAISGNAQIGALLAGSGAALLLHAQGLASPLIPPWTGPALAALGVAALVIVEVRRRSHAAEIIISHAFAAGCLLLGFLHARSVGTPTTPDASLQALLNASVSPDAAGNIGSPAPGLVFALGAVGAVLACRQALRGEMLEYARMLAAFAPPLLGLAGVLSWLARALNHQPMLAAAPTGSFVAFVGFVSPETTALSLGLALLALVTHAATRGIKQATAATGAGLGRDALLLATFCFASWHVARTTGTAVVPPLPTTLAGAVSLALVGLISVHAAWREVSPRHVYFVQLALVATYMVLRSTTARAFPPEADAVFALGLGFLLVGVTVLARRAGLPPVARATKVFAALLPLGVAIALGGEQGYEKAAGAMASALLYGTLAWVERSRLLGALGAIAVNLALLLGALASGLNGLEIYLAPLGLFLLALGHLFARTLEPILRQWLRVLGSLLLYLPAGWSIAFQLGLAPDARYALAFGAVCLTGVAAGMALRIRAYLVLGSAFLVLDILANLVHASLRNHRLGFAILSASGLLVLAAMVLSTLKRDAIQRVVRRFRSRLATWD